MNDLKTLKKNRSVTLGILPSAYNRLIGLSKLDIQTQMNKSKTRHREEFSEEPDLFSYPYGEYNHNIKSLVQEHNYRAAFTLNSGAATQSSNRYTLPRYTVTDEYGDADHFHLIIKSLPLPVTKFEPQDPQIINQTPNIGFTLHEELQPVSGNLRCFTSGQANPAIEILGKTRIELRLKSPISNYRTRINCILPVKAGGAENTDIVAWRWLGLLLINQNSQN
jgi:hypothetical protein